MYVSKLLHIAFSPRYMFLKGMVVFLFLGLVMVFLRRESIIPERQTISMGSHQVSNALF